MNQPKLENKLKDSHKCYGLHSNHFIIYYYRHLFNRSYTDMDWF